MFITIQSFLSQFCTKFSFLRKSAAFCPTIISGYSFDRSVIRWSINNSEKYHNTTKERFQMNMLSITYWKMMFGWLIITKEDTGSTDTQELINHIVLFCLLTFNQWLAKHCISPTIHMPLLARAEKFKDSRKGNC